MKGFYLPRNLNLTRLLRQHPPKFTYDVQKFKYILSTVIYRYFFLASKDLDQGVPLYSKALQQNLPNYKQYLDYLSEQKIIFIDPGYWNGHSRRYHLCDQYARAGIVFEKGEGKGTRHDKQNQAALKRKYPYLVRWFNEHLRIDEAAAVATLRTLKIKNQQRYTTAKAQLPFFINRAKVIALNNGDYSLSTDRNIHRFYSILTQLKRETRQFVTYNGKQLASIDVKNSQPFLANALFNPEFYSGKSSELLTLRKLSPTKFKQLFPQIPSIIALIQSSLQSSLSSSTSFSPLMLLKSDVTQCHSGFERYYTLVDKGNLYEYLSDQYKAKLGVSLNAKDKEQRRMLKEKLFTTFYSDNRYIGQPEAEDKRLFKELFPEVYALFALLKKGQKGRLAEILQLLESEIILRRICPQINKTYPQLPIFTIHDSIVTYASDIHLLEPIIKQAFDSAINLRPSLDYEYWQK